jgi:3-oxoacyl-[acyl-carrier-protein] synthase-3
MLIASELPDTIVDNDIFTSFGWSSKKIVNKTGIHERRVVSEGQTALDLAVCAAKKLLDSNDFLLDEIDYLIYCTQSPDFIIPNNSSLLHYALGLKESCASVDINQGCTGYLYALSLAKGVLASNQANSVLLVTSDTYSRYINPKDRANRSIFGDGATATLLSKSDLSKIGTFIFGTDGSGAFNLCVKTSGLKFPKSETTATEHEDQSGNIRSEDNLFMNGAEVFNFTLNKVPDAISSVLEKNNIAFDEINYFIFHQANGFMLEHLRDKIEIPEDKFPVEMAYTGNTVSSTIPLVLEKYMNQNLIKNGTNCLLIGFGVGYSWSATILQF